MAIKRNLHSLDRLARAVIGISCTYLGFIDQSIITNSTISILVGLFGLINIFAAVTAHCPIYGISGLSTYHRQDKNDKDSA